MERLGFSAAEGKDLSSGNAGLSSVLTASRHASCTDLKI